MIQVEVQKNTIVKEDIEFGVGTVTQTRGNAPFTGTKVNVAEMPYSLTQTFGEKVTEIQTQYDYIIANVASDPSAVPMTNLIRKNGDDLVDNVGAVFTPQVIDSSSNLEDSYVKKLWVKIISSTEHQLKRGTAIIARFNPITGAQIFDFDYSAIASAVAAVFGTAAAEDVGTNPGNVVQLDSEGKLPAVDGSELTNLPLPAVTGAPIGAPIMWLTDTPPAGHLLCNGVAVSRTTYAALFSVIGESFGPGDGTTTFELPDFRGYFLRGADNGRGIDTGRALLSEQDDSIESHSHIDGFAGINVNAAYGTTNLVGLGGNINQQSGSSGNFHANTSSTGGSETRPKNIAINYVIRYE